MKKKITVFLLMFLVLLLWEYPVFAKSYFHPSINQTFVFQKNGDVAVTDVRYYSFSGSFSWAQLAFNVKGMDDIQFQGVWDEKDGSPLRTEMSGSSGVRTIKWYYTAQDETRGFRIQYLLKKPVVRYQDVAEFYWKTIEDEHASIQKLKVTLELPTVSPNLFKLFVHTRTNPGQMNFSPDFRTVDFMIQNVPQNSFVEARALIDPGIFPNLSLIPTKRYEAILEEERVGAGVQKESSGYRSPVNPLLGSILFFIFLGLGIFYFVLFFVFYFKYGKEPKIDYDRQYEQEPPRDIPPAALPALLSHKQVNRRDMGRAFMATLLDLARRGYLSVEEEEKKGFLGKKEYLVFHFTDKTDKTDETSSQKGLLPFENDIIHLLKLISPDGKMVSTLDIENWGKKIPRDQSNFLVFIEKWGKDIKKWWETNYFYTYDPDAQSKKSFYMGYGILYFIGGMFLFVFSMISNPFGQGGFRGLGALFFPLVIVFALIANRALGRWSKNGLLEYRRWMAFKHFITDYSLMKEAPTTLLQIWDRYLVYAVALGVAEKLLRNLRIYAQERNMDIATPGWYYSPYGAVFTLASLDSLSRLESISRNMENMANLTKALDSATHTGGGFSGGGGGGGGGGSSSAG